MVVRERKPAPAQHTEEKTRDKILSAAGEVFAEQGFEGATIRLITERAKVNVAAVNYHFRDKAELYSRVVLDACSIPAAWREVMARTPNTPDERLRGLIYEFLKRLLDPARPAWKRRLMVRELAGPTRALDELVEKNIRPFRDEFLLPTLRELTGDCCTRRRLLLISASVMGQCLYYATCRPILERLNPDYEIDDEAISEIAEHISQFSLGAIAEVSRRASQS
jgi:TetR/AcrR family transcriptional regulator, regulator of cefoperazone and chloramphenicol sensitivity